MNESHRVAARALVGWASGGRERAELPSGAIAAEPAVPATDLSAALLATARREPGRPATIDATGIRSYAEILGGALSVARFLADERRYRAGDRVALVLGTTPAYVAGFHGVLLAGGVAVPIPPTLPPARIEELVRWTDCRVRFDDDLPTAAAGGRLLLDPGLDPRVTLPETRFGDLAAILLTSGSTGPPKGVMLSRGNLFANADAIRRSALALTSSDRALVTLPFHHAFGNSILQSHLLAGSALVFDLGASRLPRSDTLARHGITALYEVPDRCVLLERVLRGASIPKRLRFLGVAGGRLSPALALRLCEALAPAHLIVMYGQTEATARLTCLAPEWLPRVPDSIGRPIPGVEIRVVDDEGRELGPGETGEIHARGPGTCLGYWHDPVGTAEILHAGWLRTGDRGTVDPFGLLHHAGRTDDIVKIGGRRVDLSRLCREVEAGGKIGRCVAVPFETAPGAPRIALFVAGAEGGRDEARAWCRAHLPRDERPAVIEDLEEVPVLESGKPDRDALAARARLEWSRATDSLSTEIERDA